MPTNRRAQSERAQVESILRDLMMPHTAGDLTPGEREQFDRALDDICGAVVPLHRHDFSGEQGWIRALLCRDCGTAFPVDDPPALAPSEPEQRTEDATLVGALEEYATKTPDHMDHGVPFVHDVPQELLRDALARLSRSGGEPKGGVDFAELEARDLRAQLYRLADELWPGEREDADCPPEPAWIVDSAIKRLRASLSGVAEPRVPEFGQWPDGTLYVRYGPGPDDVLDVPPHDTLGPPNWAERAEPGEALGYVVVRRAWMARRREAEEKAARYHRRQREDGISYTVEPVGAAPPGGEPSEERVWLVEDVWRETVRYLMPSEPGDAASRWTDDVHQARRFSNEGEAEAHRLVDYDQASPSHVRRVAEHVFGLTIPRAAPGGVEALREAIRVVEQELYARFDDKVWREFADSDQLRKQKLVQTILKPLWKLTTTNPEGGDPTDETRTTGATGTQQASDAAQAPDVTRGGPAEGVNQGLCSGEDSRTAGSPDSQGGGA